MKKLPIGIQTFEQIITQNYLYVDKTEYLYKLVSEGKYYFLSRPRRFGKSLTLSTLSAIFQGEKKLFKGLFIEKTNWNWESFPILYFDFSLFSQTHDVKNLSRRINEWICHFEQEYHLQLISSGFDSRFEEFCMLTGVSKFSKISVFSGLNNLNDISMDRKYAELCGYTKEEMIKYFSKYFADFIDSENIEESQLLKQIEKWYNGFRFSTKETKVYNPISTMMLFDQKEFKHYWFETGTSAFLIELIKENQLTLHDFSNIKIPSEVFSVYEIENLQAIPLLFQTGYLTITDYNEERMLYTLDFPNLEVRKAFITRLLDSWTSSNQPESGILYQLIKTLPFLLLNGQKISFPG